MNSTTPTPSDELAKEAGDAAAYCLPVLLPGTFDQDDLRRWSNVEVADEQSYLAACEKHLDELSACGYAVSLIGVTPDDLESGRLPADPYLVSPGDDVDNDVELDPARTSLREVAYHGDFVRALEHADARHQLFLATAKHLESGPLPEKWDLDLVGDDLSTLAGRYLHGCGTLTLRTQGLCVSIAVVSDGRGHVSGTSDEEEELALTVWALCRMRGGSLVVRATPSDLFRDSLQPREIFGWVIVDDELDGMTEGEAFDELCRDAQDDLAPPDASVRCVSRSS